MRTILAQPKTCPLDWSEFQSEFELDDHEYVIVCPFCGKYEEIFQAMDYVKDPMIWCHSNPYGCGARCILDKSIKKVPISSKEIDNIQDIILYINTIREDDEIEYIFCYVELLYIKRCINLQLRNLRSNIVLPQSVIHKIIECVNYKGVITHKEDIYNSILKTYNISTNENDDDDIDIHNFNVSLNIESYNNLISTDPLGIPTDFDFSHDGILIHLLCINNKGEILITSYSGD